MYKIKFSFVHLGLLRLFTFTAS